MKNFCFPQIFSPVVDPVSFNKICPSASNSKTQGNITRQWEKKQEDLQLIQPNKMAQNKSQNRHMKMLEYSNKLKENHKSTQSFLSSRVPNKKSDLQSSLKRRMSHAKNSSIEHLSNREGQAEKFEENISEESEQNFENGFTMGQIQMLEKMDGKKSNSKNYRVSLKKKNSSILEKMQQKSDKLEQKIQFRGKSKFEAGNNKKKMMMKKQSKQERTRRQKKVQIHKTQHSKAFDKQSIRNVRRNNTAKQDDWKKSTLVIKSTKSIMSECQVKSTKSIFQNKDEGQHHQMQTEAIKVMKSSNNKKKVRFSRDRHSKTHFNKEADEVQSERKNQVKIMGQEDEDKKLDQSLSQDCETSEKLLKFTRKTKQPVKKVEISKKLNDEPANDIYTELNLFLNKIKGLKKNLPDSCALPSLSLDLSCEIKNNPIEDLLLRKATNLRQNYMIDFAVKASARNYNLIQTKIR